MNVKARLAQLNKKQVDLMMEIRKRGYPQITQPRLSSFISGSVTGPMRDAVVELTYDILEEWEKEAE